MEATFWTTPCADDSNRSTKYKQGGAALSYQSRMTAWPTPNTPSGGRSVSTEKMDATGRTADGKKHTASLEHAVKFTSWSTPKAVTGGANSMRDERAAGGPDLQESARTTVASAWPTPRSSDGEKNMRSAEGAMAEAERKGWNNDLGVTAMATMMDWSYQKMLPGESSQEYWERQAQHEKERGINPREPAAGAWPTPTSLSFKDSHQPGMNQFADSIIKKIGPARSLSPRATATSRDWRSDKSQLTSEELYGSKGQPLARQALYEVSGPEPTGSTAPTASGGALNPELPRWLQGYPPAWAKACPGNTEWLWAQREATESARCAATGTRSTRSAPPRSSAPT